VLRLASKNPKHVGTRHLFLLLVVAFTLHNAEEYVLNLSGWMDTHGDSSQQWHPATFRNALFGVSITGWLIYLVLCYWGRSRSVRFVGALMSAALVANALGHVALSIVHKSWMPGVFTGVLLILPFGVLVVIRMAYLLELSITGVFLLLIGGGLLQLLIPRLIVTFATWG